MDKIFNDQGLQKYLQEISEIKTLSREEEHELALKSQNGNKEATDLLIQANLKFVVKIASHYKHRGLSLNELISEGNIGLIKAIEKFNPNQEIKLISYAVWWIRQRIRAAIAEKTSLIRVPLGKVTLASKIKLAKDKVLAEIGQNATYDDIAEKTELSLSEIEKIDTAQKKILSIDKIKVTDRKTNVGIIDFIEDLANLDPKTLYYKEKMDKSIEHSIKKLSPRDEYIIKTNFGLETGQRKNFARIAEELGLTRERVRQIQKEALMKIHAELYKNVENDIDNIINEES